MRLERGGNESEVATIVSGTYPTVLSQFAITNTITNTIIVLAIEQRGGSNASVERWRYRRVETIVVREC